ncbi:amidase [Oceanobacillus senegalensis]|uniref:amidase n=1 Tax=Oceanobacillus senegalensis TaxID=1936063 RepID=UPI000A308662|nr:amidase [Oceanobacillus senegalensis]
MITTAIIDLDATMTAEAIKKGNITSTEVVQSYIERIKSINPSINALVENRFKEALLESNEVDKNLGEKNGPLVGVPISIKEAFHVKGMKTTGGLEHRQDLISRQDSFIVKRLKKAGAIIIGKTNTPTLCFSQETENKLYGRTNNPWDISKTAGGSSGGEGALIAVGGSAVGIGSDIGGSIRIPAHFNGIIGFKPGMNQVSDDGHFPSPQTSLQKRMFTSGPMGKSVRDMKLLYQILSGKTLSKRTLQQFKIEILPNYINYPLSKEIRNILDSLEDYLEKFFFVKRSIPPFFDESARLWQDILSSEGSNLLKKEAFSNDRSGVYYAFLREKLTQRTSIHPYLSWGIIGSKLFKPSATRLLRVKEKLNDGDKRLNEYLQNRLLIFPIYHRSAPKHGRVYQEIFSIRRTYLKFMPYVAYANVWGLPSLSIPIGTDYNNMPIGIQVMCSIGNEDAIFQLGRILEKRFRGYVRCKTID